MIYASIGFGCIYRIEHRHRLPQTLDERGYGYYENGIVVSVFGVEVFNNASTDYDDLAIAPHDPYHERAPI